MRYSVGVPTHQTLPLQWLISDQRNDDRIDEALQRMPRGSGFVFRHYHLANADRRARFVAYAMQARERRHIIALSATAEVAAAWGADAVYGPPDKLGTAGGGLIRLATAHNAAQLQAALSAKADAVFLSPVFATRSHPDAPVLGPMGFQALSQQSTVPVVALGGMTRARSDEWGFPMWAAIDGLP